MGYYVQAKKLLEYSLNIFKKRLSKNHVRVAWTLEYLGNVHSKLGNYKLAEQQLKKSLEVYKKHFSESHWRVAQVLSYLGNVHKELNQIKKAKDYYELSLSIYNKNYKFMDIKRARIFKNLGKTYLMNNEFSMAETFMKKALVVFENSNHPEIYKVYESLADLNLKKAVGLKKDSKTYNDLAMSYLKKAKEVLIAHFPKDSQHRIRIEKKLQNLSVS